MPIFALRSVRRMLDELATSLSPHRVRELEAKMRSKNDQTVPAEWEIAVGFALSRVGKVVDPGIHRPGNPDFLFLPQGSSREIIVEITSLSDENADRENPIEEFAARLRAVAAKSGIGQPWEVCRGAQGISKSTIGSFSEYRSGAISMASSKVASSRLFYVP